MTFSYPIVDSENPCYCPTITASSYLCSLRRHRRQQSKHTPNDNSASRFASSFQDLLLARANSRFPRRSSTVHASPPLILSSSPSHESWIAPWEHAPSSNLPRKPFFKKYSRHANPKRKPYRCAKPFTFAVSLGSVVQARSSSAAPDDKSFDVFLHRGSLKFPPVNNLQQSSPLTAGIIIPALQTEGGQATLSTHKIQERPFSTVGEENYRHVVDTLASILPGIRLEEALLELSTRTAQGVVDYLADAGLLNITILDLFSGCDIRTLRLSKSIFSAEGLNLNPLLPAFGQLGCFVHLKELSIEDALLQSFELVHVARLPNLSHLSLAGTGITNEAIYLLIPLKSTLVELSLARNREVDDDAVPALLLLAKLSYLSIYQTTIGMNGLRRIAKVVFEEYRVIDVEIPESCEAYIESVKSQYLWDPRPPLITEARLCSSLSAAALQRNLEAHRSVNPSIVASGTQEEMMARLFALLKVREMDKIVCCMMQFEDLAMNET